MTASKVIGLDRCNATLHSAVVCDRLYHVLRFLHFENNDDPANRDDPDYDRLLENKDS